MLDIAKTLSQYPPNKICDEFRTCVDFDPASDLHCENCDAYWDWVNYLKLEEKMKTYNNAGLYKGKGKHSKIWIEGFLYYLFNDGDTIPCISDRSLTSNTRADIIGGEEVIPETIRKYTGQLDRSKTKIFEGDIVKALLYNETPMVFPITFRIGCFWYGNWNFCEFLDKFRDIKIIGNIYDNSELLEGDNTISTLLF